MLHNPIQTTSQFILKRGFQHEYLNRGTVLKPILSRLSGYAKEWSCTKFIAPYTTVIAPSMVGKTCLIMELLKSISVVHICLCPADLTAQPPRCLLADEFLLAPQMALQLKVHYTQLLAAMFDVVAESYVKLPTIQTMRRNNWWNGITIV
jgi:hypothetical protein